MSGPTASQSDAGNCSGRILVVAPWLPARGGGECVATWALQALAEDWEVTILCAEVPDFESLNQQFGTGLAADDFNLIRTRWPIRYLHKLDPDPYSFQAMSWLLRKCRRIVADFDAVISFCDEVDFGGSGIQYIHFPGLARHKKEILAHHGSKGWKRLWALLTGRLRPWLLISGISIEGIERNLSLVNSHWTAQMVRRNYALEPEVVYPPVRWTAVGPDWEGRSNSIVCLGRLSPEKRLIEAIGIVDAIRARGHELDLLIVGADHCPDYTARVRQQADAKGDWVKVRVNLSREELESTLSRCRFGLHAMLDEHFGIAVAEMLRAGCLVFVHDDGGQVEIVGDVPQLKYRSDEDAVDKICAVLGDGVLQESLMRSLQPRRELFTEDRFMNNLRRRVHQFVADKQQ